MEIVALCLLGGALLGALIPGQSMAYAPYNIEGEPTVEELNYLMYQYNRQSIRRKYGMSFDEYVAAHVQNKKYV